MEPELLDKRIVMLRVFLRGGIKNLIKICLNCEHSIEYHRYNSLQFFLQLSVCIMFD